MLMNTTKSFMTLFTIVLLSTGVLAQGETAGRNISIPTTTTATPTAAQTPSPNTGSNNSTTPATNNSTTSNNATAPNSQNNTKSSTNSTATKLTPIPDSTGTAGNVPAPAATGGKPNGRYGPDDQYIAGFPKLAVPLLSGFFIMASTVAILNIGAIA